MSSKKEGRGRPAIDSERVDARLQRPLLDALDAFIADQSDTPTRPEAVRRLLADALTGLGYLKS